ncbi:MULTISPECIES: flagellar biosynthetic protein FliR [unclassified Janthinobacterium]|uniref:flagellar biosynthetic protein FliR n=1 Tax=unclassified Janthinobacterium TaxID=2610881 RepID=UPI0016136989|nr:MULTISPECIES: flagellar biosynthetic protein FliR [unclassified Janthinobacterium]MBB5367482.1 flagellar biosynthetic protein FliR [Janthinobacterium sp. K2C7]MBB5380040.1 flagellar biosynthetic protein FliR [Janthinobacterium sp. K2Li3]MBB5385864.1 flagellar biosynthetic protein FliR [Janthinobacterium sp. K2E3]
MLTLSSIELNTWIAALLWPLSRILGLLAAAPLFGNAAVPISVKVSLGALLAMIIAPTVPALPATDPMSLAGLLILTQEMLVGLAMGFTVRIVFSSIEMAGEISSLTMGLGFASFFDPQTKGRSSAISQFLVMLATLMFLTINGHLILLAALAESFVSLPISASPISGGGFQQLALWGGEIFRTGLQIALPVVAALLLTNVALGILTRAAPQLNIFGIGFPVTLGVGLLAISMVLPYLSTPFQNMFMRGIETVRLLPRSFATRDRPPPLPPNPLRPAPVIKPTAPATP